MLAYRGYEITSEIVGRVSTGSGFERIKRYYADVNMRTLVGRTEEEICDKIDSELGGKPPESDLLFEE